MADINNTYAGYLKATRYNTIKGSDLKKVYKPYGFKLGKVRKTRSADVTLRHQAARAVVRNYLKKKAKPK